MRYIITSFFYVCTFYANSQVAFQYDQSIPVKVNGENVAMPWTGGVNSVQYNTADLNDDGVDDLVLFDRTSNKISTYVAMENEYVYAPDYESYFPEGMTNWIIMRDYDCDGKKDIFTSSAFGIILYRNISSVGQPAWEVSIDPVTTLGTGSIINLQINGSDIPAIEDIDGDGDLDILNFGFSDGSSVQFHQNFSIERTGSCAIPQFERITNVWGGFAECECGTFSFNGGACITSGGRELHIGGRSLLVFDMDGDGDMEAVVGEEDCNTLYLLENKGTATDALMDGFVVFPNTTNPATLISFPAAFLEDINFDGKKDLLVSPNRSSNSLLSSSNFQNSSWLYDNIGSNTVPDFQFNSFNFLQREMIDHGNNASVVFEDEDGDGDLDMLITSHGQVTPLLGYNSRISLYRNIGTEASPAFELENDDYLMFSTSRFNDMKLQIADVNGDGNKDMILATTLQNSRHILFYLLNNSSSRLDFANQQLEVLSGEIVSFDNPYYFDVNKDGLVDLLLGKSNGNLSYFRNIGTGEDPNFQLETDAFYNIDISFTNRNLVPTVGDLDGDGEVDLLTTDGGGRLTIYQDFLNHLEAPLDGITDNYFNTLTELTSTFRLGAKTLPTVADLYNSGTPVIALGTAQGGVQILKNTEALPPEFGNTDGLLSVFPNPGLINFNDGIIEISSKEPLSVSIISVIGKEIYSSVPVSPVSNLELSIDTLPSGMYIVVGERDGKIVDNTKFVIAD